ncbi:MAG: type II toxin-antitoxin system ParD family antitoxin [Verrucomicrobia bacterium]|nr:type II toxin-antitoxin system ParD family antitoxin [Verrucomicrobiota bacterium]
MRQQIRAGRYKSQSEVIRDALVRLEKNLKTSEFLQPPPLAPGALEAIYEAESAREREWENPTAEASSLKAEAFGSSGTSLRSTSSLKARLPSSSFPARRACASRIA